MVALFVIWEAASNVLAIPRYLVPKPSEIFGAMVSERQVLINHGRLTAIEMLAGFAVGSIFSMAFGLLVVYWAPAKRFLMPYMIVIKTMPKVALAPARARQPWLASHRSIDASALKGSDRLLVNSSRRRKGRFQSVVWVRHPHHGWKSTLTAASERMLG